MNQKTLVVGALCALLVASVATSCASDPEPEAAKKDYSRQLAPGQSALELVTDIADYPDFRKTFADREGALKAIRASLAYFQKPSSHKWYPFESFTHARVVASLQRMEEICMGAQTEEELSGLIIKDFDVYRSVGWDGSGAVLFTAYCQPIFQGSRTRTPEFQHPLYKLPADVVKDEDGTPRGRRRPDGGTEPYPTRAEIENGRLFEGQGLELVWLRSALEAYIVHVQGSGQIDLTDGSTMYVGYAGKTDREYTSLGKELVADGKVPEDEMSLAAIKSWFAAHPEQLTGYLQRNDSYVFFAEYPPGGPYGSLGAPVTANHTIATDKAIFPRGSICAIDAVIPELSRTGGIDYEPRVSLVCDQDTGGAIRSAGRCDLFVGTGPDAETVAGYTKHEGRLFYLFLKERRMPPTN